MMEDNVNISAVECKENAIIQENQYIPTKAEEALLDIMLNPENRMKTVADICTMAKVDKATYYRAFKKPDFKALYKVLSIDLATRYAGPMVATFAREGLRGSYQHGRVILEMAGIYSEKQDVQLNVTFEQLLKKALESGE